MNALIKSTVLFSLLFSTILFSCNKDEDEEIEPKIEEGIIPAGMENKIQFSGVYNDTTTNFTKGQIYISSEKTTKCDLFLHFYYPNTEKDTLELHLAEFPTSGGTVADGTYTFSYDGDFNNVMSGFSSVGEFWADSGTVIVKQTDGVHQIGLDLYGKDYSGQYKSYQIMSAKGYFKGSLQTRDSKY